MNEPQWVKSRHCEASSCVEVAHKGDAVLVRDGKAGEESPILRFTEQEWAAFVGGVKDGEFDLEQ